MHNVRGFLCRGRFSYLKNTVGGLKWIEGIEKYAILCYNNIKTLMKGASTMTENVKTTESKSGGLARAIVALILSASALIAAVFAVSLAITVISGLVSGDFGGAIGAVLGLVFLFLCTPLCAAFAIPSIILARSAIKRARRDRLAGLDASSGAKVTGIIGLLVGATSLAVSLLSFAVAFVFAILK